MEAAMTLRIRHLPAHGDISIFLLRINRVLWTTLTRKWQLPRHGF